MAARSGEQSFPASAGGRLDQRSTAHPYRDRWATGDHLPAGRELRPGAAARDDSRLLPSRHARDCGPVRHGGRAHESAPHTAAALVPVPLASAWLGIRFKESVDEAFSRRLTLFLLTSRACRRSRKAPWFAPSRSARGPCARMPQSRSSMPIRVGLRSFVGAMSCGQADTTTIVSISVRIVTESPARDAAGAQLIRPSGWTATF